MVNEVISALKNTISKDRLRSCLEGISAHHRIQASDGYHAAAVYCRDRLRSEGLMAEILTYPASEGTMFQLAPSFDHWKCSGAKCILSDTDEVLADYHADPFSVIQRSACCKEKEFELIDLDNGTDEAAYEGIDFRGRLVFVHDNFALVRDWAVEKRGAAGYITDYVEPEEGIRDRNSQASLRRYTSFWWRPGQRRVFGFVLSPGDGDRLHDYCLEKRRSGQNVRLRCSVEASLEPGELEVVTAVLPGKTNKEIVLVSHLCHPSPSANDNASGCTAIMEGIIALQKLIMSGEFEKPEACIRILLVPEITGSYAYLDGLTGEQRRRILLTLTCDMVGGRQHNRGPVTLYETPLSTPCAGNPLALAIMRNLQNERLCANGIDKVPMWNAWVSRYSDGSDNGLLNDPKLGFGSPMLCQWPDETYHTNGDTPDIIDYDILKRSSVWASSYAYSAASLGIDDVSTLLRHNYLRMHEVLTDIINQAAQNEHPSHLSALLNSVTRYYTENIAGIIKLLPQKDIDAASRMISDEADRLHAAAALLYSTIPEDQRESSDNDCPLSDSRIPVRDFFGRLDYGWSYVRSDEFDGTAEYKAYLERTEGFRGDDMETQIIYYIDNNRTVSDIAGLVTQDNGRDAGFVTSEYLDLLARAGIIHWKEISDEVHRQLL